MSPRPVPASAGPGAGHAGPATGSQGTWVSIIEQNKSAVLFISGPDGELSLSGLSDRGLMC